MYVRSSQNLKKSLKKTLNEVPRLQEQCKDKGKKKLHLKKASTFIWKDTIDLE